MAQAAKYITYIQWLWESWYTAAMSRPWRESVIIFGMFMRMMAPCHPDTWTYSFLVPCYVLFQDLSPGNQTTTPTRMHLTLLEMQNNSLQLDKTKREVKKMVCFFPYLRKLLLNELRLIKICLRIVNVFFSANVPFFLTKWDNPVNWSKFHHNHDNILENTTHVHVMVKLSTIHVKLLILYQSLS